MVYNFSMFGGLLDALLPVSCALCKDPTHGPLPVCKPCIADFPAPGQHCNRCALPTGTDGICGQCQQQPPSFDSVHALFHYHEPVNILIQQLKYNNRLEFSRLFAELLAEKIADGIEADELLIPVPLHPARLRTRGYNQSWELARRIAGLTGIPASRRCCRRVLKTPSQTGLSAEQRRRNLKQAFFVRHDLSGKHIYIVDDVMTTGSTLNEMARTLKQAGATRVTGLVIARVVI
jgi:ComF family protein